MQFTLHSADLACNLVLGLPRSVPLSNRQSHWMVPIHSGRDARGSGPAPDGQERPLCQQRRCEAPRHLTCRAFSYGKDVMIGEKGFFVSSTLLYQLSGIPMSPIRPALPSLAVVTCGQRHFSTLFHSYQTCRRKYGGHIYV